jgi:hypothetical protein
MHFGAIKNPRLPGETVLETPGTLVGEAAMRVAALTMLGVCLSSSVLLTAQAGSGIDLQTDQRELPRYQGHLQQDRYRLVLDRRGRAPKVQIHEDQAQIQRDKASIRGLRADIRRDQRSHRHYHGM